jgi:hypothetical protein
VPKVCKELWVRKVFRVLRVLLAQQDLEDNLVLKGCKVLKEFLDHKELKVLTEVKDFKVKLV